MSHILAPFQLLELNVISAQDLAPVTRNMRTYAVAWVHPDRKLSTRVDTQGHTNPTWNDKFVFRVDEEFLYSDTSAIMIEIYGLHWFKDVHIGTVRILVANLIPPPARPFTNNRAPLGTRFAALQVRRPSGRPQGILNVGVAVLDSSMRSMPLYTHNSSAVAYRHLMGEKDAYDSHNHIKSPQIFGDSSNNNRAVRDAAAEAPPMMSHSRPQLRRTKSDTSSMMGAEAVVARRFANHGKANSAYSESVVSGTSYASSTGSGKKKGKRRSKGGRGKSNDNNSSVVSGGSDGRKSGRGSTSLLSGSLPWKLKKDKQKEIYTQSVSDAQVEQSPPPPPLDYREDYEHSNEVMYGDQNYDNGDGGDGHGDSSVDAVNNVCEDSINDTSDTNHRYASPVAASPRPQFHGSPVVLPSEYRHSPEHHIQGSPAPKFSNSPPSYYVSSPSVKFKNSPKPQFENSPKPQFQNSPKPQFQNSPKPQFQNSPKPHYRNSPKPQIQNSPKPKFQNSPMPQFQNSPKPQFQNSPKPLFQNSPKPQYRDSPASEFYRASPAMSKFNPSVGYGASNRATPMNSYGYTPRMSGTTFEYMTPRRSNLGGNMGPMVLTESELGPSASEVAADMARRPVIDEGDNSTVGGWSLDESVEGLESKLDRWRTDLPPVADHSEFSSFPTSNSKTVSRHSRRKTDSGLFSCFSTICGLECSIVCGDPKDKKKKKNRRRTPSVDDASFL